MPRITPLDPQNATGHVKELLDGVGRKLGMVPNMMRTMAQAPAVLEGYLQFSGALARGQLSAKVREQISLAVAQANSCDYCLAAHSAIGKMVGLTVDQLRDSRHGEAVDPGTDALLRFAHRVVETRGHVNEADVQAVRDAGFGDGVIAEVVAGVAHDILTNYFNIVAATEVDFPHAPAL
ncbi:alkylhydroperoxidase like protein, AhpD family [Planctopirus limnophila DSM 3776]|uniref:Alkylhydroperoxidase like protein, AhpD family n=1 Tax=Planctopirus limnophila (strain ATCC 43296 / DSM 3776 / IFAM 1008 / Mu 290) TaxID=521674 RepID=D5SQM7_PLAL2|nr:carboxymuconolactone decarboxylase family protein [Planctopirus limnophila]ADG68489.1 alkylhydroperoxidase like protein, AhpD family [Planctopirus limnophila DSM 3776]